MSDWKPFQSPDETSKPPIPPVPPVGVPYYYAPQSHDPSAPPALWPVVLVSILTGLFGIIPAAIQSVKAKNAGYSMTQYWIGWAVPCFVSFTIWGTLAVFFTSGSTSLPLGTVMSTDKLEKSIVANGDWGSGDNVYTPMTASCVAASVGLTGAGTYQCYIKFMDTSGNAVPQSRSIVVGSDGGWVSGSQ
jgi:hypothetical protein